MNQNQIINKNLSDIIIDQIVRKITDLGMFVGSLVGIIFVAIIPDKLRIWESAAIIWVFTIIFWSIGWGIGTYLLNKKKV